MALVCDPSFPNMIVEELQSLFLSHPPSLLQMRKLRQERVVACQGHPARGTVPQHLSGISHGKGCSVRWGIELGSGYRDEGRPST